MAVASHSAPLLSIQCPYPAFAVLRLAQPPSGAFAPMQTLSALAARRMSLTTPSALQDVRFAALTYAALPEVYDASLSVPGSRGAAPPNLTLWDASADADVLTTGPAPAFAAAEGGDAIVTPETGGLEGDATTGVAAPSPPPPVEASERSAWEKRKGSAVLAGLAAVLAVSILIACFFVRFSSLCATCFQGIAVLVFVQGAASPDLPFILIAKLTLCLGCCLVWCICSAASCEACVAHGGMISTSCSRRAREPRLLIVPCVLLLTPLYKSWPFPANSTLCVQCCKPRRVRRSRRRGADKSLEARKCTTTLDCVICPCVPRHGTRH